MTTTAPSSSRATLSKTWVRIAAAPRFLGRLRKALSPQVAACVRDT